MKKLSTLFGGKPLNVVESISKQLLLLDNVNKRNSANEKLSEDLKTLQFLLYGDADTEADSEEVKKMVPLILETDKAGHNLFYRLCQYLKDLQFEAKKQAAQIVCFVVRRCNKNDLPEYLQNHLELFHYLMEGFEDPQMAQHVGTILQEMAKRSEIGPMLFELPCHTHDHKASCTIIFKPSTLMRSSSVFVERGEVPKELAELNISKSLTSHANGSSTKNGNSIQQSTSSVSSFTAVVEEANENEDDEEKQQQGKQKKKSNDKPKKTKNKTETEEEEEKKPTGHSHNLTGHSHIEVPIQINDMHDINLTATDIITQLFVYSHNPNLIIASGAFEVLNILLNKHESHCRKYLEEHFVEIFKYFNGSIMSENFVNQGKFLKLLGDMLLAKHNTKIRMQYVAEKDNLRVIMTLLRSNSKLISYESFHIFKIFVANPNKNDQVHIILFKNRDKLMKILDEFQLQRQETDPEFKREKEIVMSHLRNLEKPLKGTSQRILK